MYVSPQLSDCRKTSFVDKKGVAGAEPPTGTRGGSPSKIPLPGERGQLGKDAEIRTHQALQDAKPSECPKGDRDNKSEVCFKNRLFLQAVTAVFCGCFFSPHYLKSRQKNAIIVKVYRQTLMSVGWK